MARRYDGMPEDQGVPELMGATEAAAEIGVKRNNLDKLVGLPDPVQALAGGRVWRADTIRRFARNRRRRLAAKHERAAA